MQQRPPVRERVPLARPVAVLRQLAPVPELARQRGQDGPQPLRVQQKPAPRPEPLEQVARQPQQNQAGDSDPPR